jgi:hypothetical protein
MAIRKSKPKPRTRQPKKKAELTLAERIVEIGKRIPPEELEKIPTDLARNHEHYLYGAPKQDPD